MSKPGSDSLQKLAKQLHQEIMKSREKILEAFIAETGLKPSEIEQVEEHRFDGLGKNELVWYLRRKT